MKPNCGCSAKSQNNTGSKAFLMVEATASDASTCGDPSSGSSSNNANCLIQEPTYDQILSSFVVPVAGTSVTVNVCNGSIYAPGQWIQFISPRVQMNILGVNGNNLTLGNECPNGAEIDGNPIGGTSVGLNTNFYVVAQPACLTDAEKAEAALAGFESSTEINTPELEESSDAAIIQPVGRVESDPSNSSFKKAIKRIRGVLFNGGRLFLTRLANPIDQGQTPSFRRLVINKTTGEVIPVKSYSETTGVVAGKQYAVGIKSDAETVIGPAYFPSFFETPVILKDIGGSFAPGFTENFILVQPAFGGVINNLDHFYVMAHVEFRTYGAGDVRLLLNGQYVMKSVAYNNSPPIHGFNTLVIPIKVLRSDNLLVLSLPDGAGAAANIRLAILGVYL